MVLNLEGSKACQIIRYYAEYLSAACNSICAIETRLLIPKICMIFVAQTFIAPLCRVSNYDRKKCISTYICMYVHRYMSLCFQRLRIHFEMHKK